MLIVTKDNFKKEVEECKSLCVIDLYADWCGPCKMLAPTLEALEAEFPNVKFCKVNVDNDPDIARMFKVQSIPFVALVKDNTFVDMSVGYVPKEAIAKLIREYM